MCRTNGFKGVTAELNQKLRKKKTEVPANIASTLRYMERTQSVGKRGGGQQVMLNIEQGNGMPQRTTPTLTRMALPRLL